MTALWSVCVCLVKLLFSYWWHPVSPKVQYDCYNFLLSARSGHTHLYSISRLQHSLFDYELETINLSADSLQHQRNVLKIIHIINSLLFDTAIANIRFNLDVPNCNWINYNQLLVLQNKIPVDKIITSLSTTLICPNLLNYTPGGKTNKISPGVYMI